ncbi:MAG: glycosyltransferase family 4 protein [Candidatus Hydrogenedentes bacterium]|nr:glycosyltransferase family 4 protein [Candidatus Hydrogenedentota bacterium]
MKILVLNYEYPPIGGGAAPICRDLCELFARRGHEVDVVTMAFGDLPRHETRNGVAITRSWALRKKQGTCETHEMVSYVLSALPGIIKRLRRGGYDIIHGHFIVPTGLLAMVSTRFARVPYVLTAHGSDVPGHNPDRFTFEHRFLPPLLRGIMRRAAATTIPSEYLASLVRQQLGDVELHHIPNGIGTERFIPGHKEHRLLMCGRFLPLKGFQHVLQALEGVKTDYEVHLLGDGPARKELETLATRVSAPVTFHGWVSHDSPMLKELFETSSIFCLPSARENASVALLEAMLAGMAVVTSDAAGCPETIGNAGVVVPVGDVAELRKTLNRLMNDDEACADLGRKARQRVEDVFDLEKIGDRYLELFEKVIAKSR